MKIKVLAWEALSKYLLNGWITKCKERNSVCQKTCLPPHPWINKALRNVAPLLNFVVFIDTWVQSCKNNSNREVTTFGKALVESAFKYHPAIFKTSLRNISSKYLEQKLMIYSFTNVEIQTKISSGGKYFVYIINF